MEKSRAAGDFEKQRTERTPQKCFRLVYVDHIISKCTKPPKDKNKRQKQVRFNERGNRASKNNPRMVTMISIKGYMQLWHKCMVMTKVLVEILATVYN